MINRALQLIRKYHDESLTEAAGSLGVSKSHLSGIESGKKNPSIELLGKYSEHYRMPLSAILFFAENQPGEGSTTRKMRQAISSKALQILEWAERVT